jgi:hypothetical protein
MTSHTVQNIVKSSQYDNKGTETKYLLIFLDNAASHPHMELCNVRLALFPKNTTSPTQSILNRVKFKHHKLDMPSLVVIMESSSSSTNNDYRIWLIEASEVATTWLRFKNSNFCVRELNKSKNGKGKAIPVTGRGGPYDCETSRFHIF